MRLRFPSLALGALLAAPAVADELPPGTRSVLTRENVPESSVSIVVREVQSGDTLLMLNAGTSRAPASTAWSYVAACG